MAAALELVQERTGVKPPLKWAGGKRWLLTHLQADWAKHRNCRLVEPLCGGLAIALGLRPEKALLNDINPHTINFYRWLKKGLQISLEMRNEEKFFYDCRQRFNSLVTDGRSESKEAASLFYYLNRTCYNGLCRFNRKGEFNVPFGRYKNIRYKIDFTDYQPIVANWDFRCSDFEQLELDASDFVYADPPYDVEFTHYAKDGFSWEDQERLARWLARHRGVVFISNQATGRVKRLYCGLGFVLRPLKGPRLISCTGDRTPVDEVLAIRNRID